MDRVVGIEILDETSQARMWQRNGADTIAFDVPFRPWLVSSFMSRSYSAKVKRLEGDYPIKWLHTFGSVADYREARTAFPYGKSLIWNDLRNQFIGTNPEYNLFQNMRFDDLVRFQFDIETTGIRASKDRVLMISVGWTQGEKKFTHAIVDDDEAAMLSELEVLIGAIDPDTIEGWNILGFDIPFLAERAALYGMQLNWGRDSAPVTLGRRVNFRVGSFERPVQTYEVFGRHVVDGMLVAMRYDANTGGNFESFGLKYIAETMGVQNAGRVIIPHEEIAEEWNRDRKRVITYALQDVEETRDVIALMVQPEFYLTALLPDTFQNILVTGGASKINQLLVSKYLLADHSVPTPAANRADYPGGAVECRLAGVFERVAKADVASLYPSIMLSVPVVPAQDELGVFHRTLKTLTERRLSIKAEAKRTGDEAEKRYLTGIEKSFKILINSFYGYLGTNNMHFADFEAAARVTETGREIVTDMADQLGALGMVVIEVDTDGVYFQYPEGFPVASIPDYLSMPPWVVVEIEEPYRAMLSVKAKNYVLAKADGKLKFHGNSLRSRRDEKFGRMFVNEVVGRLLDGDTGAVPAIYGRYQQRILARDFSGTDIAKRERISDKTLSSPQKARLKSAVDQTELEEGDYIYVYQRGDGTYQPIDNYDADNDRFYYLDRLFKFATRLSPVLEAYGIELARMDKRTYNARLGIVPERRKKVNS